MARSNRASGSARSKGAPHDRGETELRILKEGVCMSPPISDLLAALAAGDDTVVDEIYAHFYGLAWTVAQKRINRLIQSRVDPSDIANMGLRSALSDVANRRASGIRSGEFKALVVAIVRNKVASLFRRELAARRTPLREVPGENALAACTRRGLTPEEEVIANETMTCLANLILSGADDLDRAIGYLRFFEDYNTQEICDWLRDQGGKTLKPRAVELRIQRIRQRVQDAFPMEDR